MSSALSIFLRSVLFFPFGSPPLHTSIALSHIPLFSLLLLTFCISFSSAPAPPLAPYRSLPPQKQTPLPFSLARQRASFFPLPISYPRHLTSPQPHISTPLFFPLNVPQDLSSPSLLPPFLSLPFPAGNTSIGLSLSLFPCLTFPSLTQFSFYLYRSPYLSFTCIVLLTYLPFNLDRPP